MFFSAPCSGQNSIYTPTADILHSVNTYLVLYFVKYSLYRNMFLTEVIDYIKICILYHVQWAYEPFLRYVEV
jgi:hypothetical protein